MEHPVFVAEGRALQKLVHETAHCCGIESATFAVRVHVLLEIPVTVFEDKDQLGFGVDNVIESDNVNVLQLLHQRDFTYRRRWGPFLGVEVDFLEGDNLVCGPGTTLGWR